LSTAFQNENRIFFASKVEQMTSLVWPVFSKYDSTLEICASFSHFRKLAHVEKSFSSTHSSRIKPIDSPWVSMSGTCFEVHVHLSVLSASTPGSQTQIAPRTKWGFVK